MKVKDNGELEGLHPGVECCPCVERLRAQNKASSDEWTKRTADMQSNLDGLRALMVEAASLNRTDYGIERHGMSRYGQAALAVALGEADDSRLELTAVKAQMFKERRRAIYAESQLATAQQRLRDMKQEVSTDG